MSLKSVRWAVYLDRDEGPLIKSKWYRAIRRVEQELELAEDNGLIDAAIDKEIGNNEDSECVGYWTVIEGRDGTEYESYLTFHNCSTGEWMI